MLTLTDVAVKAGELMLVEPISLQLDKAQVLVILGETGSGKSLLAQAIMGALPAGLSAAGVVSLDGKPLTDKDKRTLWGKSWAMLAQEPTRSLDPTMSIGEQVAESCRLVAGLDKKSVSEKVKTTLAKLGLATNAEQYPHQLSGGMNQRAAFAVAMAGGAKLIIADEPTKGLDATNRQIIINLFKDEVAQGGSVLVITHDIFVASELSTCDNAHLMVMKRGKLLESGNAKAVLSAPTSDYAKDLIMTSPDNWQGKFEPKTQAEPLVSVQNLAIKRGKRTLFTGVNFELKQGQILGLVGQSGIGKSSFGDVLCGLLRPSDGQLTWHKSLPRQKILKLYQDPTTAFAPHLPLQHLLDDVIDKHKLDKARIPLLLEQLHLTPELLTRKASEVSGGELQRIAILRTLLFDPALLFADEVTSRLDPITQKETMDLLTRQCQNIGCALIIVSHERALVDFYCETVVDLEKFVG